MKVLCTALFALCLLLLQEFTVSQDDNKTMEPVDLEDECRCEGVICEPISEDKCPHGLLEATKIPCRCCPRCGNGEYEFCDPDFDNLSKEELAGIKHNFGQCGRGLTCQANRGVPVGGRSEMICYCRDGGMVCGSDGETYETKCLMRKIAFETGQTITKKKDGMCQGAPRVETPPNDVTNSTMGKVYLHCEVKGNPVPRIEWRKIGPDGPGDFIPSGGSGSKRVAIHTRGGPEEYEVTGWLQIMGLEVEDGGEYECVGLNEFGQDSGRARIVVVERAGNPMGTAQ